jgi:hypothetical protein
MDVKSLDNYFFRLKDEEQNEFYDLTRSISFPKNPLDVLYTIHEYSGEEWTKISFEYYGTIHLYWLILAFNNIDNPFEKPRGKKVMIKIPKADVVKDILKKLKYN